jgi:hypothetical protein
MYNFFFECNGKESELEPSGTKNLEREATARKRSPPVPSPFFAHVYHCTPHNF